MDKTRSVYERGGEYDAARGVRPRPSVAGLTRALALAASLAVSGCGDGPAPDLEIEAATVEIHSADALLDLPAAAPLVPRSICPDTSSLADDVVCAIAGNEWILDRYLAYNLRTPWREDLRDPWKEVDLVHAGYLPLPLLDTVKFENQYKVGSDAILDLTFTLDGTTYTVDRTSFLDSAYTSTIATGPYNLVFGPPQVAPENASRDDDEFQSVLPVRLEIETSKLSVEMHMVEMSARDKKGPLDPLRLYFSPYLDARWIERESESVLWIGTDTQGLLRLDLGADLRTTDDDAAKRILVLREKPDDSEVLMNQTGKPFRDSRGRIWFGQNYVSLDYAGPLLTVIDAEGTVLRKFDYTQRIKSESLSRVGEAFYGFPIVEWKGKKVVVSGVGAGLLAFDLDLSTDPVPVEGLIDENVSGLAVDGKGYLWASTYDLEPNLDRGVDGVSVFQLDPASNEVRWVANFTQDEGLWTDQLFGIAADPQNRIWINSNLGTYLLDYGKDPADKSDDRLVLDKELMNTRDPIFLSNEDALLHGSPLELFRNRGTVFDTQDDVHLLYDGIGFGTHEGVSLTPTLFAMSPALFPAPPEWEIVGHVAGRIVDDASGGLEVYYLECPWLLFLQMGPDLGATQDDQVWTLYGGETPPCGEIFLPPPTLRRARD
ncbi:MAG: hypothetical protein HYY13_01615 [Nitrospirae bacterium]|nr:hypothetical protein [Nitrospirota bacterium]